MGWWLPSFRQEAARAAAPEEALLLLAALAVVPPLYFQGASSAALIAAAAAAVEQAPPQPVAPLLELPWLLLQGPAVAPLQVLLAQQPPACQLLLPPLPLAQALWGWPQSR